MYKSRAFNAELVNKFGKARDIKKKKKDQPETKANDSEK